MGFATAYRKLLVADARAKLANRADFALILLGVLATTFASAATLYFMLGAQGQLAGWSRGELIFMQGFMLCIFAPQSACYNGMFWVEWWLKNGNYIRFYQRPAHPLLLLALERFHPQGFIVLAIGLLYCALGLALAATPLSAGFWLAALLLWPLAVILLWAINLLAISSVFWLGESDPVFATVSRFTDMSRYPLEIFPQLAQRVFMLLPLAALVYWPARVMLRSSSLPATWLGMATLAVLCMALLDRVWHAGLRRWAGAGG